MSIGTPLWEYEQFDEEGEGEVISIGDVSKTFKTPTLSFTMFDTREESITDILCVSKDAVQKLHKALGQWLNDNGGFTIEKPFRSSLEIYQRAHDWYLPFEAYYADGTATASTNYTVTLTTVPPKKVAKTVSDSNPFPFFTGWGKWFKKGKKK
jgi:hypothetical protein